MWGKTYSLILHVAIAFALHGALIAVPLPQNVDVEKTVSEVQQILAKDPTLPRLTRGEIIELLDNITKEDSAKVQPSRDEHKRALMLVMPYSPANMSDPNIQELYTKPPIIHIVGDGVQSVVTTTRPTIIKSSNKESTASDQTVKRKRPTKRPIAGVKSKLYKQSTTESVTPQFEATSPKSVNVESSISFGRINRRPVAPQISVNLNGNERGIHVVSPPNLNTQQEFPSNVDYWHVSKDTSTSSDIPKTYVRPTMTQSSVYKAEEMSTARARTRSTTTTTPATLDLNLPSNYRSVLDDIDTSGIQAQKEPLIKYSSQYDANSATFPKQTPPIREDVKAILASIGLQPAKTTTQSPDIKDAADNLSPEMRDLLRSYGLLPDTPKSFPQAFSTEAPPEPIHASISPDSYLSFKPLPDSAPTKEDMQSFLAGFGLVGSSRRSEKSLKVNKENTLSQVPDFDHSIIPENLHGAMQDLGIMKKIDKRVDEEISTEKTEAITHVFNPDLVIPSDEQMKKLEKITKTIKKLEKLNRTITEDDLKDLDIKNLKEITDALRLDPRVPLDQQYQGPSLITFEFSPEKNEVKRQQPSNDTKAEAAETSSTTEAASTTKEDDSTPSIKDLSDSFGSSGTSSKHDEVLPPPRRSGFYFLVDWNSFLEVGPNKEVNIRIEPKAGDPKRFINVSVP